MKKRIIHQLLGGHIRLKHIVLVAIVSGFIMLVVAVGVVWTGFHVAKSVSQSAAAGVLQAKIVASDELIKRVNWSACLNQVSSLADVGVLLATPPATHLQNLKRTCFNGTDLQPCEGKHCVSPHVLGIGDKV